MDTKIRLSMVCLALFCAGLTNAAGPYEAGEYTSSVADNQLFSEDGMVLHGDLLFKTPGGGTVVAPGGSRLKSVLPPVVWQYSGLLPVADYLKTAHLHSVSSKVQEHSWRDVQHYFYDGLLAEGASEISAKIAYAGAYALAPRWPSLELVEVNETESEVSGSTFFAVKYTEPSPSSMTVEEYRDLSLQILEKDMSLQDIQAAIDAADSDETKSRELAPLGGIADTGDKETVNEAPIVTSADSEPKQDSVNAEGDVGIVAGDGSSVLQTANGQMVFKAGDNTAASQVVSAEESETQLPANEELVVTTSDDTLLTKPENTNEVIAGVFEAETFGVKAGPADDLLPATVEQPAEVEWFAFELIVEQPAEVEWFAFDLIVEQPAESEWFVVDDTLDVSEGDARQSDDGEFIAVVSEEVLVGIEGTSEWIALPDGTLALRSVSKQLGE